MCNIFYRVADEARPPAIFGRLPAVPDYCTSVLLDDLVTSNAWLARDLKAEFLALWVNEPEFDEPELEDPIDELDYTNLRLFAAMDPVVDLESLRRR